MLRIPAVALLIVSVASCAAPPDQQPEGQQAARAPVEDSVTQLRCGMQGNQPPNPRAICDVSLVELIARPERYHRRRVRVQGYLALEFEGDAVYLHEEDRRRLLTKNGLWIDFPSMQERAPQDLAEAYVIVEGTFDATNSGHLGLWSGAITRVTRISGKREWGPSAPDATPLNSATP